MVTPNIIVEIASLCGVPIKSTGGFDIRQFGIDDQSRDSVRDYFAICIPNVLIAAPQFSAMDICRLYGSATIVEMNRTMFPGSHVIEHGWISIGSDPGGNVFAVNASSGCVRLISPKAGWNEELHKHENNRGIASDSKRIAQESMFVASNLREFFEGLLSRLHDIQASTEEFRHQANADPDYVNSAGDTLLTDSVVANNLDGVQNQLNREVDLQYVNERGRTALGEAVARGHCEIVKLLLSYGADPNGQNSKGETPLMIAAEYSQLESIRLLLDHGASVEIIDNDGMLAFERICEVHGTPEIEQMLNPASRRAGSE